MGDISYFYSKKILVIIFAIAFVYIFTYLEDSSPQKVNFCLIIHDTRTNNDHFFIGNDNV